MSYTCPKCGAVSHNPNDEAKRYCGACHAFEEDWGWLVWSFEHAAWWGPGKCGYTPDLNKAGRYTRLEALEICENANRYSKEVNEAMVHQSELRKAAQFLEAALEEVERLKALLGCAAKALDQFHGPYYVIGNCDCAVCKLTRKLREAAQ